MKINHLISPSHGHPTYRYTRKHKHTPSRAVTYFYELITLVTADRTWRCPSIRNKMSISKSYLNGVIGFKSPFQIIIKTSLGILAFHRQCHKARFERFFLSATHLNLQQSSFDENRYFRIIIGHVPFNWMIIIIWQVRKNHASSVLS